jgi:regulator of replication initiation timing
MKDDKVINLQQAKQDRGEHDLEQTIETLRQRVKELMAINETHKELMGKLIVENEELKKDNKRLAKQIDDYFNAR